MVEVGKFLNLCFVLLLPGTETNSRYRAAGWSSDGGGETVEVCERSYSHIKEALMSLQDL